jgi:hypothetical protein
VNLGQMILVLAAMTILSALILQSNSVILDSSETLISSDTDAAATSIAMSIAEEAGGKMFDEVITDSTVSALTAVTQLSGVLGPESGERYRDSLTGVSSFDDFDDFNGLFVVFKSNRVEESAPTPNANWEFIVPNIRARFNVNARVDYVLGSAPDVTAGSRTWHKRLTLKITSPSTKDTLIYSYLMSCWN